MEVGIHHARYVMEIGEEMVICQMEKFVICVRGKAVVRCPVCEGDRKSYGLKKDFLNL